MEVYDLLEGESLPGWMRDWLDEERRASALRAFELSVIPGLLQTPDYARTVLDGDEAAVTARLERQAILNGENPPTLRCVLDETVLTRGFGDAKVMRDQLEHLVNSVSPRLAVQIVPSGVRYEGLAGAFTIATVDGSTWHMSTPPSAVWSRATGTTSHVSSTSGSRSGPALCLNANRSSSSRERQTNNGPEQRRLAQVPAQQHQRRKLRRGMRRGAGEVTSSPSMPPGRERPGQEASNGLGRVSKVDLGR